MQIKNIILTVFFCVLLTGCKAGYLSQSDRPYIIPQGSTIPVYADNGKDVVDHTTTRELWAEGAANWSEKQRKLSEYALQDK